MTVIFSEPDILLREIQYIAGMESPNPEFLDSYSGQRQRQADLRMQRATRSQRE